MTINLSGYVPKCGRPEYTKIVKQRVQSVFGWLTRGSQCPGAWYPGFQLNRNKPFRLPDLPGLEHKDFRMISHGRQRRERTISVPSQIFRERLASGMLGTYPRDEFVCADELNLGPAPDDTLKQTPQSGDADVAVLLVYMAAEIHPMRTDDRWLAPTKCGRHLIQCEAGGVEQRIAGGLKYDVPYDGDVLLPAATT